MPSHLDFSPFFGPPFSLAQSQIHNILKVCSSRIGTGTPFCQSNPQSMQGMSLNVFSREALTDELMVAVTRSQNLARLLAIRKYYTPSMKKEVLIVIIFLCYAGTVLYAEGFTSVQG
jgi:hypothetical protein